MPTSFKDLENEYDLKDLPIISKRVDSQRCGKCGELAIVRIDYENTKDLSNPITLYACEWCGWNYVEQ